MNRFFLSYLTLTISWVLVDVKYISIKPSTFLSYIFLVAIFRILKFNLGEFLCCAKNSVKLDTVASATSVRILILQPITNEVEFQINFG